MTIESGILGVLHTVIGVVKTVLAKIPFNDTLEIAALSLAIGFLIKEKSVSDFVLWMVLSAGIFIILKVL